MTEDKQPTLVGVNTEFGENADGLFLKKILMKNMKILHIHMKFLMK